MVSTLQAGECCDTTKTAAKGKAMKAVKAEASCSGEKTAACCSSKKTVAKINHSVKGATLLAVR